MPSPKSSRMIQRVDGRTTEASGATQVAQRIGKPLRGNAVTHFVSHEISRHAIACGSPWNRRLAPSG